MQLSARSGRIAVSPTMKVAADAIKMKAQGIDVVDFGAGEPDFPTPTHIGAAAHRAIDANFTKYTANAGTEDLKRAIVERYKIDNGAEYSPSEVICSAGGKQALFNSVLALFGPGDEVITHMPGWPTLVEQIKLAEATPVIVDLTAVAREAARRGIWLLLDLCYDKLIYDPVPHNLVATLARHNRDHSVLCGSASKVYAMTGWRCGWAVGPAPLVNACNAIQSHSTSNVCSITQKAVEAALRGPQECVGEMLDEYRRRRDQLCQWLSAEPRIALTKPAGAFYLFPDVSDFLSPDGFRTSAELAAALLNDSHVALTPGEAFDAPGFLRISYATSMKELERGSQRILEFLATRTGARAASH